MADHFQTFPIVGQDLTGKQGKQVLQDSLDALYDLIQRMQSRSALDLRGALTVRSGRGDSPMDGDGGAGLFVQALDDYLGGRRGFDLRVLAGLPRDTNERVAEDRVTTITVRVIERASCDGKIELLNCNKTVRASVGTDGTLRAADVDGATLAAGLPGFLTDGDAPYHLKADGTKVALGGGGGGSLATLTDVDLTGLGDGDTIVYDLATTTWLAVPAGSGGGAVSEVVAGTGLVGGGTGGSVTVALDSPVDVALGGTGGTTAADARTGIGAASQADLTTVQTDLDALEATVAGLGGGAGYYTGQSGRGNNTSNSDGAEWGDFGYMSNGGSLLGTRTNIERDSGAALSGGEADARYASISATPVGPPPPNRAAYFAWGAMRPLPPTFSAVGSTGFQARVWVANLTGLGVTIHFRLYVDNVSTAGTLIWTGSSFSVDTGGYTTISVPASAFSGVWSAGDAPFLSLEIWTDVEAVAAYDFQLGMTQLDLTG